jgi:hypothetical protein
MRFGERERERRERERNKVKWRGNALRWSMLDVGCRCPAQRVGSVGSVASDLAVRGAQTSADACQKIESRDIESGSRKTRGGWEGVSERREIEEDHRSVAATVVIGRWCRGHRAGGWRNLIV